MPETRVWSLVMGVARAYAIKGEDGTILVDSGYGGPALEAALALRGIDPGDIVLAVLTHAHYDHFGGLPWLEGRRKGLPIGIGALDAPDLEAGRNADLLPLGAKGRLASLFSKGEASFPAVGATLSFSGGESLAPYGLEAEIVATPGHTRGSISVFLPSAIEGRSGRPLGPVAIIGDLVMGGFVFHRRPQAPFFGSSLADIAASLAALRAKGAKTFFPGHGGPLDAERTCRKFTA